MFQSDVSEFLEGTADAGFAVKMDGTIVGWNSAAAEFCGLSASAVMGRHCCEIVCGRSRSGAPVCQPECAVLLRSVQGRPIPAFDLQMNTTSGSRWANVSVITVPVRSDRVLVHLARDIHERKQIEDIARGFLTNLSAISGIKLEELLSSPALPHPELTVHETAVLRLLVEGKNTRAISEELHVSPATIRNHVEHLLQKLSVHSRVEAVLRAIRDRLV